MERLVFSVLAGLRGTALAALDSDGRFEVFTPALLQRLGLDAVPSDVHDLLNRCPLYREDGTTLLTAEELPSCRALAGEAVDGTLISHRNGDGDIRYLRANAAPVYDPCTPAELVGGVVVVYDVTEERALARREAALRDRLIDVINHQFRTPLTTALGHIELLEEMEVQLPPAAERSVARVVSATRRLAELARAVSELVDLETAAHPTWTDADVMPVLQPLLEAHRRQARTRDINLAIDLPPRLRARADRALLGRAVAALVDNAVTFAPAGSRVTVRSAQPSGGLELIVEDEGPGIDPAERQRLMEPFEVGEHHGRDGSRRGLGLALVAMVAAAHGGTLTLTENSPCGLRAAIVLPQETPRAATPAQTARPGRGTPATAEGPPGRRSGEPRPVASDAVLADGTALIALLPELAGMATGALEVGVRTGRAALLTDVLRYATGRCRVLRGSPASPRELRAFCEHVLAFSGQGGDRQVAGPLIDRAVRSVGRDRQAPAAAPRADIGEQARIYLGSLLDRDRWRALRQVRELLDTGVSPGVVLVDVLEAAQVEVGRLWERGELSIGQEHYCTAVTRRALVDFYPLLFSGARSGPTLVGAHAPSDLHTLGLTMVADLLEMHGWTTMYLAAASPAAAFLDLLERSAPDVLALSATLPDHVAELADVIAAVRRHPGLAGLTILVGGRPFLVDPELSTGIGADGTAVDARAALELCRNAVARAGDVA